MTSAGIKIDPVLLQVIGGELDSIAKEMAYKLKRSAYSVIIRESEDLGCAILTRDGEEICESDNTPLHVGSLVGYVRGALETLAERGQVLRPGDVLVHNHPFLGASHSLDLAVIIPIFWEGELVAFSGNTAHHLDIGGATPGATMDLFDMFAEGRIFNANFLYRQGVRSDDLWEFFEGNTRSPREVIGDLRCQVAAAQHGERRFHELLAKHGWPVLETYSLALIDYLERLMRAGIQAIPDGTYEATGWLDDDGITLGVPEKVRVVVRVSGSDVVVDLHDTPPQRANALNTPYDGSTCVAIWSLFRTLLLDQALTDRYIPANSGGFRPITVDAPLGSVFNPRYPAATQVRFAPANRVVDLILQALRPVMPDRIGAGNAAQLNAMYMNGVYPDGRYWITIEVDEGSYGGRPGKDGMDAVDCLAANIKNQPIEELELHLPLRFSAYELIEGLHGHGEFRGGTSSVREYTFLTPAQVTTESERHSDIDPPPGADGGTDGRTGRFWHLRPGAEPVQLPSKINAHPFAAGDAIRIEGVTSAGLGDPLDRAPGAAFDDLLDGLITEDQARDVYGLVLAGATLDLAATVARRAQLREARP